jgi:DNA-binding IscR family transcriptional regulator
MKFNTKTQYGLRTMIELAMQGNNRGVFQKEISQNRKKLTKVKPQIYSISKNIDYENSR